MSITTRAAKGSPLTHTEMDNNLLVVEANETKLATIEEGAQVNPTSIEGLTGGTIDGNLDVNGILTPNGFFMSNTSFPTAVINSTDTTDAVLELRTNSDTNTEWTMRNDYSDTNSLDFRFNNVSSFKIKSNGLLSATEGFDNTLKIGGVSPYLRFDETDTTTAGRITTSGGITYIQSGEPGTGGVTNTDGTGNIFLTGYNGANINAVRVRANALQMETNGAGIKMKSQNGTVYTLTVDDSGNLQIN